MTTNSTNNLQVPKMATEKQIAQYHRMCEAKKVTPLTAEELSRTEISAMSALMQQIYDIQPASSPAQHKMIRDLVERIQSFGLNQNAPTEQALNNLDKGKASLLIETLNRKIEANKHLAKASDKQIEYMWDMFYCPDVDFGQVGLSTTVELDEINPHTTRPFHRRKTKEEFLAELKTLMASSCAKFLDDNRVTFNMWRSERITPKQVDLIRTLEDRLGNLEKPRKTEVYVDIEGNIVEAEACATVEHEYRSSYEHLNDEDIRQLSRTDASTLIDRINIELADKSYTYGKGHEHQAVDTRGDLMNSMRTVDDQKKAFVKELTAIDELIYKLEATVGHTMDNMHDAVSEFLLDGEMEHIAVLHEGLKYVLEDGYISEENLLDLASESSFLTELIERIVEEIAGLQEVSDGFDMEGQGI